MDKEARCAYVHAQVACAMSELMGMQAANQVAIFDGQRPPYGPGDFHKVQYNYTIGHNAVIEYLRD